MLIETVGKKTKGFTLYVYLHSVGGCGTTKRNNARYSSALKTNNCNHSCRYLSNVDIRLQWPQCSVLPNQSRHKKTDLFLLDDVKMFA